MTRIQSLASRPKRTLGALAVVLAAVGITVGSGANFQATKANAGTFAAGKLSIGNETNKTLFTATKMIPGAPDEVGTVDVTNNGDVGGLFYVKQAITLRPDLSTPDPTDVLAEDTALKNKLTLNIVDCGNAASPDCSAPLATVYNGAMSGFASQVNLVNLGGAAATWAPGQSHRFQFTIGFPDAGGADGSDDAAQGGQVSATYTWKATS